MEEMYSEMKEMFIKMDDLLTVANEVEGVAFILWDSLTNGLGEADRKIANSASLLSDKAIELRNGVKDIQDEMEEALKKLKENCLPENDIRKMHDEIEKIMQSEGKSSKKGDVHNGKKNG